jgi:hypothetical protein
MLLKFLSGTLRYKVVKVASLVKLAFAHHEERVVEDPRLVVPSRSSFQGTLNFIQAFRHW